MHSLSRSRIAKTRAKTAERHHPASAFGCAKDYYCSYTQHPSCTELCLRASGPTRRAACMHIYACKRFRPVLCSTPRCAYGMPGPRDKSNHTHIILVPYHDNVPYHTWSGRRPWGWVGSGVCGSHPAPDPWVRPEQMLPSTLQVQAHKACRHVAYGWKAHEDAHARLCVVGRAPVPHARYRPGGMAPVNLHANGNSVQVHYKAGRWMAREASVHQGKCRAACGEKWLLVQCPLRAPPQSGKHPPHVLTVSLGVPSS